jgi:hypothetical protein
LTGIRIRIYIDIDIVKFTVGMLYSCSHGWMHWTSGRGALPP